jgi:hypothetical protein
MAVDVTRFVAAVLASIACLASAGCGASEPGAEGTQYLDPRSDAVVAVDLDYDGGNWQQVKRLYARAIQEGGIDTGEFTPPTLDGALGAVASSAGLSFADDVRPLLGGTLHVGVRVEPAEPLSAAARDVLEQLDPSATRWEADGGPEYFGRDGTPLPADQVEDALREQDRRETIPTTTAVYRVEDREALGRVLDKLRGQGLESRPLEGVDDAQRLARGLAVVGGDTLVAVMADDEDDADRLLRERLGGSGEGPEVPVLEEDFVAARAAPTLLGAWLDREELTRALGTDVGRALRGADARIRLEEDAARATARVDFDGLAPEELPLPGPGPLALPAGEGVASASANQSLTTVFLARVARELYPDSRFVRRVEQLEEREGVRFEDEVLRQFAGPSFSVLRPDRDGEFEFGARSTLRDPAAMRALLARIAPDLPGILEGLQGLGSTGLTGLLFVAPDAPLTPAAFGLLAAVRVSRLAGGPDEELYEVRGLDTRGAQPGPDRVVYGLIGEAFVVASSAELAREVAGMSTEPAPEAATRLRVDVARLLDRLGAEIAGDEDATVVRALLERAEASASAKDGDIAAEAEVRWAR